LKFQVVAEKTAKDARGLLYFAAPGRCQRAVTSLCTIYSCYAACKGRDISSRTLPYAIPARC